MNSVVFKFDDSSLKSFKNFVEKEKFSDMASAVRESLIVNRAIRSQVSQGYTEIIVRDPKTGDEKLLDFQFNK